MVTGEQTQGTSNLHRYAKAGMKIGRISVAPVKERPVFNLSMEVVFEDDCMAIVNKPAGYHCKGIGIQKIDNALSGNLRPSTAPDMLPGGPVAVHRLDARTSGLLVVAKTRKAHMSLSQQFDRNFVSKADVPQGKVQKKYICIVMGKLDGSGLCDSDIYSTEKDVERFAQTRWRALEQTRSGSFNWEWVTTVECEPLTGRTHQIRIHMQRLGHPICGDDLYECDRFVTLKGGGLFLTSTEVSLDHPLTGERLKVQTDPPYKFEQFIRRQSARLKPKDRDAQAAILAQRVKSHSDNGEAGKTCIELLESKHDPEPSPKRAPVMENRQPVPKRQRGPDRNGAPPYLALPVAERSPGGRSTSPCGPFAATADEQGSFLLERLERHPVQPFNTQSL